LFEADLGARAIAVREPSGHVGAEGGVVAGQSQDGPRTQCTEGLANGWASRETALDAGGGDQQRFAADVVELALAHQRVDARASDAKPTRGLDGREELAGPIQPRGAVDRTPCNGVLAWKSGRVRGRRADSLHGVGSGVDGCRAEVHAPLASATERGKRVGVNDRAP